MINWTKSCNKEELRSFFVGFKKTPRVHFWQFEKKGLMQKRGRDSFFVLFSFAKLFPFRWRSPEVIKDFGLRTKLSWNVSIPTKDNSSKSLKSIWAQCYQKCLVSVLSLFSKPAVTTGLNTREKYPPRTEYQLIRVALMISWLNLTKHVAQV